MDDDEDQSRFDWDAWWRVPSGLPHVDSPPPPAPGELHLVHHANGHTVARYDPRSGRARPAWYLPDGAEWRDARVDGRYLPIRSGVLAYSRDTDDRIVVQHRRRRVVLPPGAACTVRSLWAIRRLQFHANGRPLTALTVLDAPARWRGPLILRLWDFTWFEPDDFDLVLAIAHDLGGDEPPRRV